MALDIFGKTEKTSTSTNTMFPALEKGWTTALGGAAKAYGSSNLPKQAPLNADIRNSFNQTRALASQGVPNLDALYAAQGGILGNGGMTGTMQDSVGYLTPFANGSMQEDPRLAAAIAEREKRAMNGAATQFGGGRYGSVGIGQGMGQAMTTAGNELMLQSNENSRNRQLQAAGQIGQLGTAGAQNMATWGAMSSGLNDLRYDGASREAGIGQYLQDRTQGRIDQKANFPWQNVQNYTGVLGGMGNQGSTQINKTPGPSAAQSILGGAATGGALFGPWGAVGGGLLGAFA
jgi:hypothetical protein